MLLSDKYFPGAFYIRVENCRSKYLLSFRQSNLGIFSKRILFAGPEVQVSSPASIVGCKGFTYVVGRWVRRGEVNTK